MNQQPSILKYLALLIFIGGMSFAANSQNAPYVTLNTAAGNKLNIILPADITARIFSAESPVTYSIWLEKGDGNYLSTFSNGIENIPVGPMSQSPYMLASKLYESPRRPPTSGSSTNIGNPTGVLAPISSPQLESSGGIIKLFSNVREVVADDTMVFCISYTPNTSQDSSTRYKVIFRYNSPGQNAFNTTSPTSVCHVIDYLTRDPYTLPNIRTYNNESVSVAANTEFSTFSNAIAFDDIIPSNDTSNIFISLLPVGIDNLPDITTIEAEIFYQNNGKDSWHTIETSRIDNMVGANAHDPNSVSVFPRCLSLPQTTQKLHYTIKFQNTGAGDADTVKIVFYFPPQMNRSKLIENLVASYSDTENYPLTDIVYDWVNGKIIFTLGTPGDLLEGTLVPFPVTNPKTMGQISFDLEIVPGSDVNQSAILEAWAEIYFHGVRPSSFAITSEMITEGLYIPGTAGFEMPVRTQNAVTLFSNCCTAKRGCKCSHPRSIWQWLCCYWWIIIIILLIFVIWWLYKKKSAP